MPSSPVSQDSLSSPITASVGAQTPDLAYITQQMYRQNKELADTNRTLSLLRAIDAIVLESHVSMKQVCLDIARSINDAMGYPFVGLFLRAPHAEDQLVLQGWSTPNNLQANTVFSTMRPFNLKMKHAWFEGIESHRLVELNRMSEQTIVAMGDCTLAEWRRIDNTLNLKSLYLTKLVVRHHLVGLLVIGFHEPMPELSESTVALLDRLRESVGVALDNKLLFEENRYVLRQLRDSNSKLRALDETKDDFISMASHQLRTPLTSVKGYLSMVIEGDAGKLNDTQIQMLGQAFTSAQRMVFLITDLLNVSRLKTGKFVIDSVPTSLSDLAAQEVSQLKETAQIKNIELIYKQPVSFPKLMLDEIKIRQVVMNFIDNAIYYTPEGGCIRIELHDKPTTVELHVTDNGIGVPKDEQHHLFTKFYRASNARKARPDGTGLGLFMAQKVIVAQGGSILFSSKEGKGSSFGFIFAKAPLAIPQGVANPSRLQIVSMTDDPVK
jgi:signal transduction histidine kinase